ncbi:GGDEF domain-containing protein, partial [Blautia wexlerae]|nr:GGDEF domain-containing protein [Blautia wexlerae]
ESVEYLTEFARRFAPVCCLALVRLSARKTVLEGAACKDAVNCGEGAFQKLVEECLPQLIEIDQSGGEIEDEKLVQMLFGSGEAPIFPSMLPVRDEGALTGFIFVGKETARGPWTPQEKERLAPLSTLVGISFANRQFNEEYLMQNCAFNAIMDSMRANLYVTDVRTDQILFMNKTMKEAFRLENPEGKICWQVLQKGMTGRCPFCPVETLRSGMENTPFVMWEECNTLNGHTYQNYDSLMRWIDGSLVHFQQSIDITESKKLSWAARMDDLTNLLNRRAGKEALRGMLSRSIRENVPVTVCLFDVNGLKEVNDLYGHAEGDAMLCRLALEFQACIRPSDLLFRLSGDEFIMACWDFSEYDTGRVVQDVRTLLAQDDLQCGRPYRTEFCCGIFETAPDNGMSMKEILAEADSRMYEQKRRSHIERAER